MTLLSILCAEIDPTSEEPCFHVAEVGNGAVFPVHIHPMYVALHLLDWVRRGQPATSRNSRRPLGGHRRSSAGRQVCDTRPDSPTARSQRPPATVPGRRGGYGRWPAESRMQATPPSTGMPYHPVHVCTGPVPMTLPASATPRDRPNPWREATSWPGGQGSMSAPPSSPPRAGHWHHDAHSMSFLSSLRSTPSPDAGGRPPFPRRPASRTDSHENEPLLIQRYPPARRHPWEQRATTTGEFSPTRHSHQPRRHTSEAHHGAEEPLTGQAPAARRSAAPLRFATAVIG